MSYLQRLLNPVLLQYPLATNVPNRLCSWTSRSHRCGQLRLADAGKRVTVAGWVQHLRLNKFLVLRDAYGTVQLMLSNDNLWDQVKDVSLESVIEVSGVVAPRPQGQANPKMETGDIEINVDQVKSINLAKKLLPFQITEYNEGKEPLRMQYRYLDLRRPALQANLRLRSNVVMQMRQFLVENDFVDIETPTLFRRTPGGAREFVVPTHEAGKFYTLVQSPQQFKQLLMVGGMDRYFQIARCYRDEGARPDRQPEFTQVDIELSFTNREGIEDLVERLLVASWPQHLPKIKTPFLKMTYKDCMSQYGCDKPDLRILGSICDLTSILLKDVTSPVVQNFLAGAKLSAKGLKFSSKDLKEKPSVAYLSKELPDLLKRQVKASGPILISSFSIGDQLNEIHSSLSKKLSKDSWNEIAQALNFQPGDIGFIIFASDEIAAKCLSKARSEMGHQFMQLDPLDFRFLWVEDFPLFLPKDNGGIESGHHPFTQPHPDDLHWIETDPLKVRGLHYDLVLNGFEIGGGSIRVHDPNLQEFILNSILHEDTLQLSHLLAGLASGCPPHGGIALGLDRLMAILCNANSIRDVMAFPKSGEGKDLMADAPAPISDDDKSYYHLKK